MEPSKQKKTVSGWRIALLALLIVAGITFLALSLRRVQVVECAAFTRDQVRQSVRRVQIPGARGRIFDRNGVCLADNRASFCIAYYVEELRQRGPWINTINRVDNDVDRLAEALGVPRQISRAAVSNHVLRSLPMPMLAWRDVDQTILARWAEAEEDFPGVDVYEQPERTYPHGTLASHVLGYVRRDKPQSLPGERFHFFLPETFGTNGVERQYNDLLTGHYGGRLIRVDARGYKHATWDGEPATRGRDLYLTLDLNIQRALESSLSERRGAGVVIDPRNGEVLAMASAPAFDPNLFVPSISFAEWNKLLNNTDHPLINRAIQGRYAPGSTFKPVTALAALMTSGFNPEAEYDCDGVFKLGTMRLRCWNTYGHGPIALRRSLEQSCNCYFCNLANNIGWEPIYSQAQQLGLGSHSGIDLPSESSGLLPTAEWKERVHKDRWRPGDTCQLAIGQGQMLTTPLQMALLTAGIANGKELYRPFLARYECQPTVVRQLNWPYSVIAQVRQGMLDVAALGTGRRVQVRGIDVAAKTGTAEYDSRGVRRKNTWVTAFAPFESPTIAVAIVVEDGDSGGLTVAPMVRNVLVAALGEAPAPQGVPQLNTVPEWRGGD